MVERQAFDVVVHRPADADHLLGRCRYLGTGINHPDRDVLLADEQPLATVIGDAALGLAVQFEAPHQLTVRLAGLAIEAVLDEGAVLVVGDRIGDTLAVLEHAQAVDIAQRRGDLADIAEHPACAVDGEQVQAVVVSVAGHGQVHALAAEAETAAHIDVVQPADGQALQLAAFQVVHHQPALLVGAEHAALRRIARIDPDRRVIGGVPQTGHRAGLHRCRQTDDGFGMRQCLWLPRQLGAMQALLVRQQQVDSFGRATRADAFRLIEAVQRQHAVRLPTRFALAVEVQRRRLGIQGQQTTRHQRHASRHLCQRAERLDQIDRLTLQRRLGIRRVAPEADVLLVNVELPGLVIGLAEGALRRQAEPAHAPCFTEQAALAAHQPLLADTFLAEQEYEVVARAVAVQAQPLDGKRGARQIQRLAPGPVVIQADQHRLLALALHGGQQQAPTFEAMVEALETPAVLGQCVAGLAQQAQALLVQLDALGMRPGAIAGQQLRVFEAGLRRRGDAQLRTLWRLVLTGGLAGGQGDAQAEQQGFG